MKFLHNEGSTHVHFPDSNLVTLGLHKLEMLVTLHNSIERILNLTIRELPLFFI